MNTARTVAMIAALGVLAPLALAGSRGDPREELQRKEAELYSFIAESYVDLGTWLSRQQMNQWANEDFERALRWDPQNAEARRRLGYVQRDGRWERDPNSQVPSRNEREGDAALAVARDYDNRVKRAYGRVGDKVWDLAELCERHRDVLGEEYQKYVRLTLDFDPTHRNARRAQGYRQNRSRGNIWMNDEMASLLDRMQRDLSGQPGGSDPGTPSEVGQRLNIALTRRATAHWLMEAPHIEAAMLENLNRHAEQTLASYRALFRIEQELVQSPVPFTILASQSQHEAYIDNFAGNTNPRWVALAKESSGLMNPGHHEVKHEPPINQEALEDRIVHGAVHTCLHLHSGGADAAWLEEGLAYFFSDGINGSRLTHCTNLQDTRQGGGGRRYSNPEAWASAVRQMVQERTDPPMLEVISVDTANLTGARTVKAWSVVDWLMFEYRDKLGALITSLSRYGKAEDRWPQVIREVFGWEIDEMENRWRTYVRFTYPG
jgi:hypothetical protein